MTKRFRLTKVAVLSLAVLLSACAKPIYNVDGHMVPHSAQSLPLDKIQRAIIDAGARRGWTFEPQEAGHLVATQKRPEGDKMLVAVVDVYFTQTEYRIQYKSSENLGAQDGKISKHYVQWIRNLEKDIETRLAYYGVVNS